MKTRPNQNLEIAGQLQEIGMTRPEGTTQFNAIFTEFAWWG
jgi:hypothetical protein